MGGPLDCRSIDKININHQKNLPRRLGSSVFKQRVNPTNSFSMILKCHGLKQLLVLAMQLDGRCRVSIIYTQYKHKLALRWHFTHPPLYQRHMPLLDNRLHRSSTCWPVRPHFTTDKIYWSRQPRTGSNTKATTWLSLS